MVCIRVMLEADIPIIIYFGDYIDNGPEDIMSTGFWKGVRDGAVQFAESYNADSGDCTVVNNIFTATHMPRFRVYFPRNNPLYHL